MRDFFGTREIEGDLRGEVTMIDCEKSGVLARSRADVTFQILESGVEGVDFFGILFGV